MTHLWMQQTMHQHPVAETATTDAGAYGQIEQCVQSLPCAPAPLAQDSSVDIGIEADGYVQRLPDAPNQVGMRPAWLRCRGDAAVVWRATIQRDGAERADTNGADFILLEECDDL